MRVILADDAALFRSGLARLLAGVGVEVVAEACDGPGLLAAVESAAPDATPDAVIVDIRMPPDFVDEGLVAAEQLRRTHPELAVLVLSTYVETGLAVRLLESGAGRVGYLLKDRVTDVTALHQALARLLEGQAVIDPDVVAGLLDRRVRHSPLAELSSRERDVLRCMAEGRSNAGIAAALFLSERTVENHVARLLVKLDIDAAPEHNRRVRAVLLWLRDRARVSPPG
ncbi:response regulator transcription factor [Actinomycetospora sp. NBRC 106375]|uniref:response regulator transcription factor n=1 Tax=Actinomycetospora sp. NBRC 106375 TaxID=3032207 RepID=UPI002554915A|nr:response regulator transcription factor [Actinomycetospora sp. NBRC 106375]